MKYNFDELVDRVHEDGSYSSKWSNNDRMAKMFLTDKLPEDRLVFFLADMDFRCPPELTASLVKEAQHGVFGYSSVPEEYYQAVCRWMRDRFGMEVKPEEITTARGAHSAIVDAIQKLTKPGDGVIVPRPTYYYSDDVMSIGRHYCGFQMKNDNGYYTYDWEAFEALCKEPQNTMAIFQQPHNPTGRAWTDDEIRRFASICRENNVIMLCDDVHMDIKRKDVEIHPFIKVVGPEGIVMITGINKTFNLAGLAVTNVIIQDPAIREKMGHSWGGMSPFGIRACISAYTECDDWLDQLNDYLDDNIDYVVDRFHKELPKVKVWKPEGTYILWLDFTDCGFTNEELDQRIAGQAHIGFSDGAGLEPPTGTLFRRMCVPCPRSMLVDAMDRLVKVLS